LAKTKRPLFWEKGLEKGFKVRNEEGFLLPLKVSSQIWEKEFSRLMGELFNLMLISGEIGQIILEKG